MATFSTMELDKLLTKLDFQRRTLEHWKYHNSYKTKKISKPELEIRLKETPNYSCLTCYPVPKQALTSFINFLNAILQVLPTQHIWSCSSKSPSFFIEYLSE